MMQQAAGSQDARRRACVPRQRDANAVRRRLLLGECVVALAGGPACWCSLLATSYRRRATTQSEPPPPPRRRCACCR